MLRKQLLFMQFLWVLGLLLFWFVSFDGLIIFGLLYFGLMVALFAAAYNRVTNVLTSTLSQVPSSLSTGKSGHAVVKPTASQLFQQAKLNFVRHSIRRTAIGISLTTMITFVAAIGFLVLGSMYGDWRQHSQQDEISLYLMAYEGFTLGLVIFFHAVFSYLWSSFLGFNTVRPNDRSLMMLSNLGSTQNTEDELRGKPVLEDDVESKQVFKKGRVRYQFEVAV